MGDEENGHTARSAGNGAPARRPIVSSRVSSSLPHLGLLRRPCRLALGCLPCRPHGAGAGLAAGDGLFDLERVGERQAEEILVEAPCLFRVAATIGVVMQTLDHGDLLFRSPARAGPWSRRRSR